MMKKLFALLLVVALCVGALSLAAITATAAGTTKAADEIDYRVGYAKTDINPYWSIWEATGGTIPTDLENYSVDQNGNPIGSDHIMPLPMGGYGGNVHRLSRPELIDDNGSGVHASGVVYLTSNRYTQAFAKEMLGDGTAAYEAYAAEGFGQNDGDGIYATCVAIQQNADAEPVLMFSVDLISVSETYAGQAKNVIIRELKKQGVSISPERILINATHTHGAVSLGESFTDDATYNQKLWGNSKTVPFPGSSLSSYLNTYRKHLYAQLAAAAVKALTDGQNNGSVVMEKGTLDVSDVTGYQLNGVRHRKAQLTTTVDGTSQTVDYVTGSSFNVDLAGETEISGVSESNDKLHVLQFSFPESSKIEPILLINWRAHTTANNKMDTKAFNNLSADFVAAMRYQLEQWGYRPILNYSTSGNLGMGDTPSTYNISTSATATTMNATKYGNMLALAAAYLADGTAKSGVKTAYDENLATIQTKYDNAASSYETANSNYNTQKTNADNYQSQADNTSISYLKNYYQGKADDAAAAAAEYKAEADKYAAQMERWSITLAGVTPVMTTCSQGEILLESAYYSVAYQASTDAEYQAALYHDALAVDEGGSATNDGGLKLEKTGYPFVVKKGTYTANGKEFTISDNVVIASQYHSNSLKNRKGTINAKRISLCAFTLGDQVAFVTMPFEASDRYSMSATLNTANNYNDWDNLVDNSKWGTPFTMSLTNGAEGYIPNNLAYTYTQDLEAKTIAGTIGQAFVSGSYEAHIAYSAAGEGEKIVAELNTLLRNLAANGETEPTTKTGYCEACKETVVWTALNDKVVEDNGVSLASGHYYLAEDYTTIFGRARVYLNETVCLDLNGHTYYSNTAVGESQVFLLYGTLNVMDSAGNGKMMGKMAGGGSGGTVEVASHGVLNLYSGTLTCDTSGNGTVSSGGVVYVGDYGTFNMYGGAVTGGKVANFGGNVSAQHSGDVGGTFNMYGGTISGGTAGSSSYANLMVSAKSFFRYNGGTITTGAFMQGTMYLGNYEPQPVSTGNAVVSVRNSGTVTLDGVFTGQIKLSYSSTKNPDYSTDPTTGSTLGAVTSGSWIDHAGGAKISAHGESGNASGEGYVSGNQLLLGAKPTAGHCSVCNASVNWVTLEDRMFYGHYVMNQAVADMAEKTIPAGSYVCLDLNGNTYSASGRAFTVNGTLNIQDTGNGGVLQGTVVDSTDGGTIYVGATGTVNQSGGKVTCQQADNAAIAKGGVVFLDHGTYNLSGGNINGGKATTGGNIYLAGGNLNLAADGSIMNGTATDGGNLYIAKDASFTMTAGNIVGGSASRGGNVYIPADAAFIFSGGLIDSGTATSTGGNVCVASGASFTMNDGSLADGWAEKEGAQPTGGNVYTAGEFNLNGGNIYGGYAYYGGNVQVQSGTAYFTMAGGTISEGSAGYSASVANLCTSTGSHFRLEGGYIAGVAYVQGYVTLAGTTTGTTPIRLSVKNAHNALTVEGTYTGKIDLVFNGNSYALGDKIGNAETAAIGAAQITAVGHEELQVVVVGNELQLAVPDTTVAKIGNSYFDTFADAMEAYIAPTAPVVLMKDLDLGMLTKDVMLDLNGFDVTGVITNGFILTVFDSATADFDSPNADSYGTVPAVSGIKAAAGYMDILADGKVSYHKYEMELQYVNISPSRKGLSYSTTFKGDQLVKAQVKEFGIAMRLHAVPNETTIWADPDNLTHVALKQSDWQTGDNAEAVKSVYIKNILDWDLTDEENAERARMEIYGRSYIQLQNGQMIFSTAVPFSMQSATEAADAIWGDLDKDAQESLLNMYLNPENHGFMQNWNLPNVKIAAGEVSLDVGV